MTAHSKKEIRNSGISLLGAGVLEFDQLGGWCDKDT